MLSPSLAYRVPAGTSDVNFVARVVRYRILNFPRKARTLPKGRSGARTAGAVTCREGCGGGVAVLEINVLAAKHEAAVIRDAPVHVLRPQSVPRSQHALLVPVIDHKRCSSAAPSRQPMCPSDANMPAACRYLCMTS